MWLKLLTNVLEGFGADPNRTVASNTRRIDDLENRMRQPSTNANTTPRPNKNIKQKTQVHVHVSSCSGCNTLPRQQPQQQPLAHQRALGNSSNPSQSQGPNRYNQNQGFKPYNNQGAKPGNQPARAFNQGQKAFNQNQRQFNQNVGQGSNNVNRQRSNNQGGNHNANAGQSGRGGYNGNNRPRSDNDGNNRSNASGNKKVVIIKKTVVKNIYVNRVK